MKSVIVTGANGFVGCALVKELLSRNIKVCAVVRNNRTDRLPNHPLLKIVSCEMDNIGDLYKLIKPEQYEVFYHLAWAGSTGNDRSDYSLQLMNTKWSLDSVNAASLCGCKTFVGAGSLAEFDVNAYTPTDGAKPNSVSHYGTAKIATHYMTKAECNKVGINHLWAYLTNTFGIGNFTSNFVNFAAKLMITGQPANFTPAEQPYDFLYVSDTAYGLYCIGKSGKNNNSYYIGSLQHRRLKEYIELIRNAINPYIIINFGVIPFNGVIQPDSTFDCSKIVRDTGFKPAISFEEGLRITIPWIRKNIAEGKI